MSRIFVWIYDLYPAFVVAFHLGSCLKSGCRLGHQWFLYELCLPVKTRPETSAVPGRKTLWLLLSGSCTSSLISCVCVCAWVCTCACVRACPSYETEGTLPTSLCWTEIRGIKGALGENVRSVTLAIVLPAPCVQENTHDPIKMFHHVDGEAAHSEPGETEGVLTTNVS